MKNLFKNLMLVAVAAMAFTACTETNEEVNAVSKKTVISGVLNIENDDTRSVFLEKEDENQKFYKSAWEGGEYIRLYFSAGFSDYTEIDEEGNFEIEYIGDFEPGTTVTICSPDDAWSNVNDFVIPSEQTPLANSVDPLAHILKSGTTEIVNNTISATMSHQVAYGKMTINGFDGKNISSVKVELNGESENHTYTLNVADLSEHTYWFATEAINVTSFTVTATVDEVSYSKTVDMAGKEKPLAFNIGKVSTFSVSDLKEVAVEASAKATLVTGTTVGGFNPYDVTFSFENGDQVVVRFATIGKEYLHFGDWQSTNWQQPHYISYASYNGEDATITACNVAYENDAYVVALTVNTTLNYTFTGTIQGLYAPEACDCFEEPEPDPDQPEGGDVIEIEIARIYVASYGSDYDLSFYIKNKEYDNILINVWSDTYNNSGTYSFAYNGDTSNGFANCSTHQYVGTPIDSGTLVVTVDGSTRTFDFTFMVGKAKYHFNFTATE